MTIESLSTNRSHGGVQSVLRHHSSSTNTDMTFSAFVPASAPDKKLPVLWFLSGLTCTHANVTEKAEYRRACAEHGIILIAPDTSPRGADVADDEAYDLGQGAGFYVDATQQPWTPHFRMRSYIEDELPQIVADALPTADLTRQGITGHSMGGHGALTIALRNPGRFKSISAFSAIVSPIRCPWGQKALAAYLGTDKALWREYDAVALIEDGARVDEILIDQGEADPFLGEQLKSSLLARACNDHGIDLTLRLQPGYDHSYYFISTFMADHVAWHAERLKR